MTTIRFASLTTASISALFLLSAIPVLASTDVSVSNNGEGAHTNVNVQTNTGGNTICRNGKCTTTSSDTNSGTSKVCVNGVCHTSNDGNVNYQSDDGNTKVNINSKSGSAPAPDESGEDHVVVKPGVPTITPTVFKDVKGMYDNSKAKKVEAEKKLLEARAAAEAKKSSLQRFFENELASIKKFFTFDFLFGKK